MTVCATSICAIRACVLVRLDHIGATSGKECIVASSVEDAIQDLLVEPSEIECDSFGSFSANLEMSTSCTVSACQCFLDCVRSSVMHDRDLARILIVSLPQYQGSHHGTV